jgi:4'-phosphopantetheinyl transferase
VTRNQRIGIDIEQIHDIAEMNQIASRFFSRREYELLCSRSEIMKQKMFFEFWTRKEALIKAIGTGLYLSLPEFDATAIPDEPIRFVRIKNAFGEGCQWAICDMKHFLGFIGAVALEWPRASKP